MLKIVLRGEPTAQQRMRLFKRGNRMCIFDPQGLFKKNLKQLVEFQIEDYEFDGEVWNKPSYPLVDFIFYMPIPKSLAKKDRTDALNGRLKHTKKPDVDNLLKLYLDVIANLAIDDDNAVHIGSAVKVYSEDPRTVIYIRESDRLFPETYDFKPDLDSKLVRYKQPILRETSIDGDERISA